MPGGVDLLVNNAGMGNYADFATQDPEVIRQIIELNVVALFDLSQKAVRHMKGARNRSDPANLVRSWLHRHPRFRVLCRQQARGQRPRQEPALRVVGDRSQGLGGVSRTDGQ